MSVALVIQHAMRMRCLTLSSVYHIFPHYLINGTIFEKKIYWTLSDTLKRKWIKITKFPFKLGDVNLSYSFLYILSAADTRKCTKFTKFPVKPRDALLSTNQTCNISVSIPHTHTSLHILMCLVTHNTLNTAPSKTEVVTHTNFVTTLSRLAIK